MWFLTVGNSQILMLSSLEGLIWVWTQKWLLGLVQLEAFAGGWMLRCQRWVGSWDCLCLSGSPGQGAPRCAHTVILQKAPTQHLCLRVFMLTFLLLRPASSVTKQYISFRKLFVQQTLLGARRSTVALDSCRHGWQRLSFKSSPLPFHKQAEVEGGSPRTAAWAPTFNCVRRFVIFVLSYTLVWKAWLFSFLGHYRFRIEQRTGRMVGLEEHWKQPDMTDASRWKDREIIQCISRRS